jgi:hypothetical protein
VIGSELMDSTKPSGFTLQSGLATLRLQGADLESAVVKPDAAKTSGAPDAGSYNRMLIGTGSIGSGNLLEPLAPRQVSFVGSLNVAPIVVASVSPTMFSPLVTPVANTSLSTTLTKSTLVAPLPTSSLPPVSGATSGGTNVLTTVGVLKPPPITTALVSAPPPVTTIQPVYVAPIFVAPIYVAPITTVKKCTVTLSGLKVCI